MVERVSVDVSDSAGAVVIARGELRHLCPFRNEVDEGYVSIEWRTGTCTLELHALRTYLDSFAEMVISHEELTNRILHDLQSDGSEVLSVSTQWHTGGMSVRVECDALSC